jgi:hypothetical protein
MGELALSHWEAVLPQTSETLVELGNLPMLSSFYLAGGTALALRLGHRISQDLDLFANLEQLDEPLRQTILSAVQNRNITILQNSPLGLVIEINGTATSFFSYGYPLLSSTDSARGIAIAPLLDIGLMKLDAIAGRGMRKDFYDIFFIAEQIPLDELFARAKQKYPHTRNFAIRVLTALVDFDVAEQQADPTLLIPIPWDQVKAFCESQVRRLGNKWIVD